MSVQKDTLVKVNDGRWVWYEPLMLVDFIPRGKQVPTKSLYLKRNNNTREGALIAIISLMDMNETSKAF